MSIVGLLKQKDRNLQSGASKITDPLLMEQLSKCPIKQHPSYAEKAVDHLGNHSKEGYLNIITNWIAKCEKESQRKKLKKLLRTPPTTG